MPKIIVFGSTDISALYLSIDGAQELKFAGKNPQSVTVSAGAHRIFATTVSKFERALNNISDAASDGDFIGFVGSAIQNATNTTVSGELVFEDSDVLLIEVRYEKLKPNVYGKIVPALEASDYVHMDRVVE